MLITWQKVHFVKSSWYFKTADVGNTTAEKQNHWTQ